MLPLPPPPPPVEIISVILECVIDELPPSVPAEPADEPPPLPIAIL
jgi:hypothetical protein